MVGISFRHSEEFSVDYRISSNIESFRSRLAAFVERELIPLESDRSSYDPHENIRPELLQVMRGKAKEAGLWCLQLKPESGGIGLDRVGMAVCYEEMNR